MTPTDLLSEIQKLPLEDAREVAEQLTRYLHEKETASVGGNQDEAQEDKFERSLLAKGIINHIPSRDESDDEFDRFEPIQVEGEPLSETIIRERR